MKIIEIRDRAPLTHRLHHLARRVHPAHGHRRHRQREVEPDDPAEGRITRRKQN
jgi:hypothetical protein